MKRLALFVGIDQYEDQGITPLRCAARDARQLAAVFEHRLGFSSPVVLTEKELNAGRSVMRELRKMEGELSEGDLFVLFFAGHGKATESDQIFLLPSVSRRQLESGMTAGADVLSYKAIKAETEAWRGVQRVFIFDACRSPMPREEAENRDGNNDVHFQGEIVYRDLKLASGAKRDEDAPLVVLNSCQDQQKAEELENYEEGHGLFTAALLEELKTRAAGSQAVVLDDGFSQTLGQRMQQLARKYRQRETSQTPLLVGRQIRLYGPEASQNQQIRRLLDEFETQFAAGQLERPVGECCRDTLAQLASQSCDLATRRELASRLQTALDAQTAESEQIKVEQEKQARLLRDEQRIAAARLLGTQEAYANYLSTCEECENAMEAQQAIEVAKTNGQDEAAWQAAQRKVLSTSDLFEQKKASLAYAQNWEIHQKEAEAKVSELDVEINKEKICVATVCEHEQSNSDDEKAWKAAIDAAYTTQNLKEKLDIYQNYTSKWHIHLEEVKVLIGELERNINECADAENKEKHIAGIFYWVLFLVIWVPALAFFYFGKDSKMTFVVLSISTSIGTAWVAHNKSRRWWLWAFVGGVFSGLGFLFCLLVKNLNPDFYYPTSEGRRVTNIILVDICMQAAPLAGILFKSWVGYPWPGYIVAYFLFNYVSSILTVFVFGKVRI